MAYVALILFLVGGVLAIVGAVGKTKNLPWAKSVLAGGLAVCAIGLVVGIIMRLAGGQ